LLETASAGDVDWEEDRPCDKTSYQAAHDGDLEEAQKEISVQRVVVENI
jgi:hypothetical protein